VSGALKLTFPSIRQNLATWPAFFKKVKARLHSKTIAANDQRFDAAKLRNFMARLSLLMTSASTPHAANKEAIGLDCADDRGNVRVIEAGRRKRQGP
jgi:hypothetical protein